MSTAGTTKSSSADFRTLPLSEQQAIISRFDAQVSDAIQKHPSSKEWVCGALHCEGPARCSVELKRTSLDEIFRYDDDLADPYCQFLDDVRWVQPCDYGVG